MSEEDVQPAPSVCWQGKTQWCAGRGCPVLRAHCVRLVVLLSAGVLWLRCCLCRSPLCCNTDRSSWAARDPSWELFFLLFFFFLEGAPLSRGSVGQGAATSVLQKQSQGRPGCRCFPSPDPSRGTELSLKPALLFATRRNPRCRWAS